MGGSSGPGRGPQGVTRPAFDVERRPRPAAFLDRDGTLIDELGYLGDPAGVVLFPGAAQALRRLNDAGIPVVLVTNQSGLARGYFTEEDLARVHGRLCELLATEGARIDLILHAAFHPEFPDPAQAPRAHWRKPEPGMLIEAAKRLNLDLASSTMVGDTARDLEAGARAGVGHLALVRTGKGRQAEQELGPAERARTHIFETLAQAVDDFLRKATPSG